METRLATLEKPIFQGERGFFVALMRDFSLLRETFRCVGVTTLGLVAGTTYTLTGETVTHKRHGKQFRAAQIAESEPIGHDGAMLLFRGVCTTCEFERIWREFGSRCREYALHADNLQHTCQISQDRAEEIAKRLRAAIANSRHTKLVNFLSTGIKNAARVAVLVDAITGKRIDIERIIDAPMTLLDDGIGIKFAEALALYRGENGAEQDDLADVFRYWAQYVFVPKTQDTVYTAQEIARQINSSHGFCFDPDEVVKITMSSDFFFQPRPGYYSVVWEQLQSAEETIFMDSCRCRNLTQWRKDFHDFILSCPAYRETLLRLNYGQIDALDACLSDKRVVIVSGGPGTGKTFFIQQLCALLYGGGKKVAIVAFTGKAIANLKGRVDCELATIHSVVYRQDETLRVDYLIIEEASMVDSSLLSRLFKKLTAATQIIFVGDKDQIPPIMQGQPFQDLFGSDVRHAILTETMRQAAGSEIIRNARRVLDGEPLHFPDDSDVEFVYAASVEHIQALTVGKYRELCQRYSDKQVQIIYPRNKGELSCAFFNRVLMGKQIHYVPLLSPVVTDEKDEDGVKPGFLKVAENDKIICTRNQTYPHPKIRDDRLVNGDMGVYKKGKFYFHRYPRHGCKTTATEAVQLAFCITVHKAQGSEYDAVILPVHRSCGMYTRRLLYTAITRAKKKLVIVGTPEDLQIVATRQDRERKTYLQGLISGDYGTSDSRLGGLIV